MRRKLTHNQKRAQRRAYQSSEAECLSSGPLDMSAEDLKLLLKSDASTKKLMIAGNESQQNILLL